MVKKFSFLLVICLLTLGLERTSYAEYSFRVILKYPFSSLHYDTLGNIVSDSLVRARPIKPIIFRSVAESLYQESVTNDSGYAVFVFDKWQDNTPVLPNNISRMAIDFPCTDKVIEVNGQITFEHLKYSDIDFRRSPGEIEIILPLTVYKDSFAIGSSSWINVCNIAIMNDMHIGDGYNDFGTYGWNDADSGHAPSNEYIINNHNVVVHINQHNPDFVVVLGDVTQSAERSEFQRARSMLGNLNTKPYIPIFGNHDAWPYVWTNEASIPSDCFIGEYFYDGFETMFDSVAAIFPNWRKDPYFSSSPNLWSYYLNLSFDFQNWKFVGADFNSRNDAPWPWFGILGEADVNNHTLQWITQNVNVATNERRKLFVLGHHPLIERLGWWGCFTAHEIHQISDAGLKNNQPSARWVGGHVHGASHQRIDTTYYGDDTVAIVFTLNGACENGVYGWVSIYDKLYARIWHTPFDPIYGGVPALADFQTTYSYIGSENAYSSSYWEFGDGTVSYLQNPSHLYHLYDSFMKNFKVTLTVTAANGRKVSTCKQIRVVAMPYDLRTTYPGFLKEDSVKLVWNFDCPQCVTGYLIYRGGCLYAEVNDPNQKYYIDANVQRGITYGYRVHAKRYGSGMPHTPPATLNVQVPWVDAPTVRQPVEIPPNQVRISWHNNSNYAQKYIIHRWDDITNQWHYGYHQANSSLETLFVDNVEWLHKYKYAVVARATSASYDTSAWSNIVEYTSGLLAQSDYPKMSAYNNSAKVARWGNNVYVAYTDGDWGCGTRHVYCLRSTDGGNSFVRDELHKMYEEDHRKSQPAIAISNNGIPYVVWGSVYWSSSGKGTAGWFRSYYCAYYTNNNWQIGEIYSQKFSENQSWTPPEDYIGHPSLSLTSDSGYVAFKFPEGGDLHIVRFLLGDLNSNTEETIANTASINAFPSIGYDKGNPSNPGDDRIVVLVHEYGSGPLKLYYRTIGSTNWQPVSLPDGYGSYGSPSLWAGQNELRITFEGWDNNNDGLFFLRIPWNGNTYDVNQPLELISSNFDCDPGYIVGYSYLASREVVLWIYDDGTANTGHDDVYYSRRVGGVWSTPVNISETTDPGDISSYPQGIVFGSSALGQKLFALWTEKSGNNYYLVRKVVNLPPAYQYPVLAVAQSDIPEATGFNNSRRLIRDRNGILHLAFTSGDSIYHTFLQDTSWAEPVPIGEGKYPALAMDNNGKIHCVWSYNQGMPYFLEELRYSCFDGNQWSSPIPLMHTYNSFFWGIGAPSLAIKDSFAYITFKSYFGPTYHPEPGGPAPQVIILESRNLIFGKFNINNPLAFTHQSIDVISITPTPYDPYVYQDSLVPLLISPSITVDLAGIPHILWEGDSTNMRYYTIVDTNISTQVFDENVDFPFLGMNGDQIQLFYTARDSIRYRYSWTGRENLSQIQTIASCESPISSGQYLTWAKKENGISHLYYGAIPASGPINPIEVNYSTDLISYPQILFNQEPASIDLVWTEYSEIDSIGTIYYLNLPITEVAPKYAFDMGIETAVPICVQRDGYKVLGIEDYKTIDYDSTELIYHLTLHSPHTKYKIRWVWYHEEKNKIKLQFNIDDIFHRNRWVNPQEKVIEESWIPDACIYDNEITIKVKLLNGTIAVLSGFEIYAEEVGGGGPQGEEAQIAKPFYFDRIYPNPTKGIFKIRYNSPDNRKLTIKLYDVCGRLVHSQEIIKSKIGINEVLIKPDGLSAGVYFVRLETDGYQKVEKAILLR